MSHPRDPPWLYSPLFIRPHRERVTVICAWLAHHWLPIQMIAPILLRKGTDESRAFSKKNAHNERTPFPREQTVRALTPHIRIGRVCHLLSGVLMICATLSDCADRGDHIWSLLTSLREELMAVSVYALFSDLASLCSHSMSSLIVCVLYPRVLPSSFFQGSLAAPVSTRTQVRSLRSWN